MSSIINPYRLSTGGASNGLLNGLLAHYDFEETSGSICYDGHNSNDGTITGATINQTGKLGKCYSYDGAGDYVDLGAAFDFYGKQPSISCWVKFTSLPSSGTWTTIYMNGSSSTEIQLFLDLYNSGGTQSIRWGTYSNPTIRWVSYNHSMSTGVWYHIAGTHNGTNWKLYIDNIEYSTTSANGAVFNNSNKNVIGAAYLSGFTRSINGLIDHVDIYDRNLSTDDISALFNSGAPLPLSNYTT